MSRYFLYVKCFFIVFLVLDSLETPVCGRQDRQGHFITGKLQKHVWISVSSIRSISKVTA